MTTSPCVAAPSCCLGAGGTSSLASRLTRRLLADDPGLAVLVYTGVDDQRQIDEALDSGARGVTLKAGSPQELIAAIRALAEGGTYRPEVSSSMLAPTTTAQIHELSPREREILGLLAQGLTGVEAAKRLWVSPETARTHVRNAMTKLEAHTRVHAVALALSQKEAPFERHSVDASAEAPPRDSASRRTRSA